MSKFDYSYHVINFGVVNLKFLTPLNIMLHQLVESSYYFNVDIISMQ